MAPKFRYYDLDPFSFKRLSLQMNMLLCVEEQEQDEERKKPWKNTNLQKNLNVEPKVYETF